MNAKNEAVMADELSQRTWADYRSMMDMRVEGLGKHRPGHALEPQDFAALTCKLATRNDPVRMSTVVVIGVAPRSRSIARACSFDA